jgi:hypothetical protein
MPKFNITITHDNKPKVITVITMDKRTEQQVINDLKTDKPWWFTQSDVHDWVLYKK